MIAYSAEAEPARAYLLRNYNDIDIFVEDATCGNMYVRLFNRMLEPHGKRITHVFPLHGRQNVLTKCAADQGARPRRRLYLIDGDADLILQIPLAPLNHLYRLNVYCAENLLLSEHALVTIATECDVDTPWHQVALDLSIRPLMERSVRVLLPLFVVYAVVQHFSLTIQTSDYPIQRFLEDHNDPASLCPKRVRSRVIAVVQQICSEASRASYREVRNAVVERLAGTAGDRSAFISGKSYLLPLLHLQLKKIARFQESQERLKVRLAGHCELDIDPGLNPALVAAATA